MSRGSAELAGSQGEQQQILVSLDVATYNVRKATCGTVCWECDGAVDSSVFLSPFAVAVSGTAKETFYLTYNTGGQYDYSPSATWSSSSTSTATVNGTGVVSGVRVGSFNLYASIYDFTEGVGWYCTDMYFYCPTSNFSSGSGGSTVSLSCSPSSVVRGGTVTCTVSNAPSGTTYSAWQFTDGSKNTVSRGGNNNVRSWSGVMVTSGTVSVTISGDSSPLTAAVSVTQRTWHTAPASPTSVPNGTFITLPVPPQNTGTDSGLGYSKWQATYSGVPSTTISDAGPNAGYYYYTSNFNFTQFYYQYEINPDLANTSSTFYTAQCGNYNASSNPNGFISGANLLTQTDRHEWNSSTQSHYAFYSNGLNSNNLGDYLEARVAPPGADISAFDAQTANGITSDLTAIKNAAAVEPYAVNYSELGVNLGNINYLPYTACP